MNTSMLVRGSARQSLPTDSLISVKPSPEGGTGTVGALMQPHQQVQVTLLSLVKPLLGRKHRCSWTRKTWHSFWAIVGGQGAWNFFCSSSLPGIHAGVYFSHQKHKTAEVAGLQEGPDSVPRPWLHLPQRQWPVPQSGVSDSR